jgi:hypothetical protein
MRGMIVLDFNFIFNLIGKLGSYMIVFAISFFILKYSICKLLKLSQYIVLNKFYLDDLLSILISISFIMNHVIIGIPKL